jgi:type II secretory pathway pseudopilin PulG
MSAPVRARLAGFTLIEALIALGLGAVAIGLATSVLLSVGRSQARAEASRAAISGEVALAGALSRLTGQASAAPFAGDAAPPIFEGEATRVRFAAATWGRPGAAGRYAIELQLVEGGDRPILRVRGAPVSADGRAPRESAFETWGEAPLAGRARFVFLAKPEPDARDPTPSREEIWDKEDGWPLALVLEENGRAPLVLPLPTARAR